MEDVEGAEGCRLLQGAAELGIMQSSNRPAALMARRLPRLVRARGRKRTDKDCDRAHRRQKGGQVGGVKENGH
jgi:hypothetical protein